MLENLFSTLLDKIRCSKKAVIGGIEFDISILSFDQEQKINSFPEEEENPIAFYDKTKTKVLSYAINSIDGYEIPDIVEIGEGDEKSTKEKSLYLVDLLSKLPHKIVDMLFEVYIDFKDQSERNIDEEIKYEWFKTPEEREKERKEKQKKARQASSEDASEKESEEVKTEEESEKEIVLKKLEIED